MGLVLNKVFFLLILVYLNTENISLKKKTKNESSTVLETGGHPSGRQYFYL